MDGLVSINSSRGLIIFTQMSARILGNSSCLCLYILSWLAAQTLKPMDLILYQLVLANNLVLFSKGIPQTMATSGLKSFLDGAGCKFVFCLHREARGTSLSTTCCLSGFQALKLCTRVSGWLEVRMRSPKCICFCCSRLWTLHLLLTIHIAMHVTGPENDRNLSRERTYRYCSSRSPVRLTFSLTGVIYSFSGALCLNLMVWASGSMAFVLHRHKRRVQHLHSSCLSPRPRCEARATRTILTLVSLFVSFDSLSSILSFWLTQTGNPSHCLLGVSAVVSSGFPTLSPFVFIFSDTRVSEVFSVYCKRKTQASAVGPVP